MPHAICDIVYIFLVTRTSSKYCTSSFTVPTELKAKFTIKGNESKRAVQCQGFFHPGSGESWSRMTAVLRISGHHMIAAQVSLSAFSLFPDATWNPCLPSLNRFLHSQ